MAPIEGRKIGDVFSINENLYIISQIRVFENDVGIIFELQLLYNRHISFRLSSCNYNELLESPNCYFVGNMFTNPALKLLYR